MNVLAYTSADATWIAGAIPLLLALCLCAATVSVLARRVRERRQAAAYRQYKREFPALEARYLAREATKLAEVEHEGATEAYGAVLQQVGRALPSADLRTTGEQMVADHAELAGISDAMDSCSERIMHELRLFLRDDTEYARVARWGGSILEDTGTFNRADLDRALAAAVK